MIVGMAYHKGLGMCFELCPLLFPVPNLLLMVVILQIVDITGWQEAWMYGIMGS